MSTELPDTIVALASGSLPAGIAVVRVSGAQCELISRSVFSKKVPPRKAVLRTFRHPVSENELDKGLAILFPGPESYTGETVLEFHAHGGRAVVDAILDALCEIEDVRLADAGEFTRRAFENGRMDLTEVDGLVDLIASQTEKQRRVALSQSHGALRDLYEDWRTRLIHVRALIEAEFDFSDEEDVPDEISVEGFEFLGMLIRDVEKHLEDGRAGEIITEGFRVSLIGEPNIGKSSLLNTLAKREVAIVTEEAGTTRDVLDVHLDVDGFKVIVSDTAGIREAASIAEKEGIRRARYWADNSDLVLVLVSNKGQGRMIYNGDRPTLEVITKDDDGIEATGSVSSKSGHGMEWLITEISDRVKAVADTGAEGLITRKRYRQELGKALEHLKIASSSADAPFELRAEELRLAGDCIGRITGRIDVEDLLDVIFSEFCVGK